MGNVKHLLHIYGLYIVIMLNMFSDTAFFAGARQSLLRTPLVAIDGNQWITMDYHEVNTQHCIFGRAGHH